MARFIEVGGSGRRPFRIRRPRGWARGVWVRRDVEKRARIVVDGVVKDVDTGGGWGVRGVLFIILKGVFPYIFMGPPRVAPLDGSRRVPASGPLKM